MSKEKFADNEIAYAAVMLDMLDRQEQTAKKLMAYPVSRLELISLDTKTKRVFYVNDFGQWVETT